MHGILALDALLVARTGNGQTILFCITVSATPSISIYTECYSCMGVKQKGYSQTACQECRAVVRLLWQPSNAMLIHSAQLHKHSSLVQALLVPMWRSLSNLCCPCPIVAPRPIAFMFMLLSSMTGYALYVMLL